MSTTIQGRYVTELKLYIMVNSLLLFKSKETINQQDRTSQDSELYSLFVNDIRCKNSSKVHFTMRNSL